MGQEFRARRAPPQFDAASTRGALPWKLERALASVIFLGARPGFVADAVQAAVHEAPAPGADCPRTLGRCPHPPAAGSAQGPGRGPDDG